MSDGHERTVARPAQESASHLAMWRKLLKIRDLTGFLDALSSGIVRTDRRVVSLPVLIPPLGTMAEAAPPDPSGPTESRAWGAPGT
jgi:hypothetical protein